MASGRLIYVVGPSGSGKDTLLDYARQRLDGAGRVAFAHRYITRPADAGGENHIALTDKEFAMRCRAGLFAMNWHSHAMDYGVGIEIDCWLAKGVSAVVNGSRAYLPQARKSHPDLRLIWITAGEDTIRTRLVARGRENTGQIQERLERDARFSGRLMDDAVIIPNEGPVAEAGEQLVAAILREIESYPGSG
ncbi:phosphonate metabolism protein/1,5-bisphosphokinase (PRPP-forming) PhnN [Desulfonatronum thioautotrophicum]|uniref:phosphonate metabolism protein/1,5-bisphosphokinase (PRPP-forming) PhnN n=1 Tax=Desulfonatronum thioautotrophicum TaxID=617001 RepID=UPI0005EB82F6|nr:phosphonate metabolism protein/1,5-bisphosphokinase (PRPP-forming) PhnN [Desulfonatronum thioautotrophicum]